MPTISCVLTPAEVQTSAADVIVFPEGVSKNDLETTSLQFPKSIVIGAHIEDKRCRGALYKAGRNQIDYIKVFTDGRTVGCGNLDQRPIYQERDRLCIGVVICMDIDNPTFRYKIFDWLKAIQCQFKLLCIPSDMGGEWLANETLPWGTRAHGFHFALCNNTISHPDYRCKSFVTDQFGQKIAAQREAEPVTTTLA